jgi:hypothetical protein
MEWLRKRRVILPALATLESLVRSVRGTVERQVYWQLANSLAHEQKTELAKLLDLGRKEACWAGCAGSQAPAPPPACSISFDAILPEHRPRDDGGHRREMSMMREGSSSPETGKASCWR